MLKLFDFFPFGADPAPRLAEWDAAFAARTEGMPALFAKVPAPNGEILAVVQGVPFKLFDGLSLFWVANVPRGQAAEQCVVTQAFSKLDSLSCMVGVLSPESEFYPCRIGFDHIIRNPSMRRGYSRILNTSTAQWTLHKQT